MYIFKRYIFQGMIETCLPKASTPVLAHEFCGDLLAHQVALAIPSLRLTSSLASFSFLFQVSHRKILDGATPLQILEDPGSFGAYQIG